MSGWSRAGPRPQRTRGGHLGAQDCSSSFLEHHEPGQCHSGKSSTKGLQRGGTCRVSQIPPQSFLLSGVLWLGSSWWCPRWLHLDEIQINVEIRTVGYPFSEGRSPRGICWRYFDSCLGGGYIDVYIYQNASGCPWRLVCALLCINYNSKKKISNRRDQEGFQARESGVVNEQEVSSYKLWARQAREVEVRM